MKKFLLLVLLLATVGVELLHGQTMKEFIGVNIRAKDAYPQGFSKFGILREYHEWASDIGYDADNIINCPQRKIKLNPAVNDPSTLLNFDGFYSAYAGQAYPTLKGLAPEMRGLQSYGGGVVLEQKPFCQGLEGLVGYGDGSGSFSLGALNQNAGTFAPTVNGFYDGIVSATVSPGDLYTGSVTIQLPNDGVKLAYEGKEYFMRIWIDYNEDGKFENKYIGIDASGYPILDVGESIDIVGADNHSFLDESGVVATDKFLKLDENNFTQNNNFTQTIDYDFKIPPGTNPGLIKMRVAFTAASPESYDPATGLPKFWQLPTPTGYGSSAMWDVGLVNCNGSSFTVPSWNESYYGIYNDIFGKITNLKIQQGTNPLIDKTIAYQDANGKHQNFFDVSSVIYFDKDYEIQVGSNLNTAYFGMWLMDKNGAFSPIIPPSQISGSPFSFSISSMNNPNFPAGMYRARMAIGDVNISPSGGFVGEIRDYLVIVGNDPTCNGLTSLGDMPPSLVAPGVTFKDLKLILKTAQDAPETWLESAKWASMITAKYGKNDLYTGSTGELKDAFATLFDASELPQSDSEKRFGLGLIDYVEIGNEMDKFWRGDKSLLNSGDNLYQMIPSQFEAYLSANYDGACKDPMFEIGNSDDYYGVKNMDDKIDVAMGGMAGMQGGFLEKVIDFAVANRSSSSCSRVLPFDIINLHHYCTTLNVIDEMSGKKDENENELTNFEATYQIWDWNGFGEGHGVSPEAGGLRAYTERTLEKLMAHAKNKGVLDEFVNCDVWISEFGYDSSLGDLDPKTTTSWVAVPVVGDNSFQETQAQWNVRSFLELAAVKAKSNDQTMEVNRAMIFDYRDDWIHPNDPTYNESGLRRDGIVHNSEPKKSWFHVQTMRNVLGGTTYQGEFTGKNMDLLAGQFDLTSEARIQYYKGDYKGHEEADVLVIWSPNASDSEGELTLDLKALVGNFSDITSFTLITPQDGDEDGKHEAILGLTNTYTFTGEHAITETPMYVVLNVADGDTEHECFAASTLSTCNSMTISWKGWGLWGAIQPHPTTVDIYTMEGYPNDFDVTRARLHVSDYAFRRRSYSIGNLSMMTVYTVVLVYKWSDGSTQICFSHGRTTSQMCRIEAYSVTINNQGNGNNATNALNYEYTSCADFGDDDDDGYINGLDSDADGDGIRDEGKIDADGEEGQGDGIVDLWQASDKVWNSGTFNGVPPSMVIDFDKKIFLSSISFLHTTGNGSIKIEYKTCDCDDDSDENWVLLYDFAPNGYMNWVHLGKKPNGLAIAQIRITREHHGPIGISMLSFCGVGVDRCELPNAEYYVPPSEFFFVHRPVMGGAVQGDLKWEPFQLNSNDPNLGTAKKYEVFYQKTNTAEMDFTQAKHKTAYAYEGLKEVSLSLNDLEPDTEYKAYLISRYPKLPCNAPLEGRIGVLLPHDAQDELQDGLVLTTKDTIIYFNTYPEGYEKGSNKSESGNSNTVQVSPNPTTGYSTVHWSATGYTTLTITNGYTGGLVAQYQVEPTDVSRAINVSNLGNGPYHVRLTGANQEPLQGQFIKTTE